MVVPLLIIVLDLAGFIDPPGGFLWVLGVIVSLLVLNALMRVAPRSEVTVPVEVEPPVRGRWLAINSPGQQVPSHGTATRGQLCAVDIIQPTEHGDRRNPPPVLFAWRGSQPEEFTCFGEPIHAVAGGVVVEAADGQLDQRARNTWQSLLWMVTAEGVLREMFLSTRGILGNRVVIRHHDGTAAAYAHLKRGSATVAAGDRVEPGQVIGAVGNTGNTSQPHLHVQLMDQANVDAAAGVPMRWSGIELEGIDPVWEQHAKEPGSTAVEGMPRDGQTFAVRVVG